jgi:hypothetical protein
VQLLARHGERQFLIRVNRGKIEDVLVDPGPLDDRYQFAIRASAETWRKFSQETPPPMFHGIWAASFQKDIRLEGDLLVMMQNLRYLTLGLRAAAARRARLRRADRGEADRRDRRRRPL